VGAVFNRKPVWVALQCYTVKAVSEAGKSREGVPRLPRPEELRCMSYLALAAGARGLLYYAFDDTYYNDGKIRGVNLAKEFPEFWQQMTAVIKELAARQHLWTAPYAQLQVENQSPAVVVQRRPYLVENKIHLLVVNPTYREQKVRLRLPGLKQSGAIEDALGGPSARVVSHLLTDSLEPLQAKCYALPLK